MGPAYIPTHVTVVPSELSPVLSAEILVIYLHLCCTKYFGGANKLG